MRTVEMREHVYYVSEEINGGRNDRTVKEQRRPPYILIDYYSTIPRFSRLVGDFARETGQRGFHILHAHGDSADNTWVYENSGGIFPVQNWIDAHDGQALALMIACCNPMGAEIQAQRSLVIHPRQSINLVMIAKDPKLLRVYVPGRGYLE